MKGLRKGSLSSARSTILIVYLMAILSAACSGTPSAISASPFVHTPSMEETATPWRLSNPTKAIFLGASPIAASPTPEPTNRNRSIVIGYMPSFDEVKSDIWLLETQSTMARPFQIHDNDSAYCCPIWSPEGESIFYVKTDIDESRSSLWTMPMDGGAPRQIGEEMQRGPLPAGIPAINPIGWTLHPQSIWFSRGDDILNFKIRSNELGNLDLASFFQQMGWNVSSSAARIVEPIAVQDKLLMWSEIDGQTQFFILDLQSPQQSFLINPPPGYSSVTRQDSLNWYLGVRREFAPSPDGNLLLAAGHDESKNVDQLWLIDLLTGSWSEVFSSPGEFHPDSLAWSSDQRLAAWWVELPRGFAIFFVNTSSWEVTRSYRDLYLPARPRAIGWANDVGGHSPFAVLLPGRGILLLDPLGGPGSDHLLVSYDELRRQLPFAPEEAETWAWQP